MERKKKRKKEEEITPASYFLFLHLVFLLLTLSFFSFSVQSSRMSSWLVVAWPLLSLSLSLLLPLLLLHLSSAAAVTVTTCAATINAAPIITAVTTERTLVTVLHSADVSHSVLFWAGRLALQYRPHALSRRQPESMAPPTMAQCNGVTRCEHRRHVDLFLYVQLSSCLLSRVGYTGSVATLADCV